MEENTTEPRSEDYLGDGGAAREEDCTGAYSTVGIVGEFPQNPLFARELTKFDASPDAAVLLLTRPPQEWVQTGP
jgi:hypothetical protein